MASEFPSSERRDPTGLDRLESWKEIAAHLRTSVRTVQRWEKTEALPVHRHPHSKQDTVFAFRQEVDQWHAARSRAAPKSVSSWMSDLDSVRGELRSQCLLAQSGLESATVRTVGRREELQQLGDAFSRCIENGPRILCITGEPGIGKTALLDDFLTEARQRCRCRIARGLCSERLVSAEAYRPVMEILADLTRGGANQPVFQLLKLVAPAWYVEVASLWASADPSFATVLDRAKAASPERLKREFAGFLAELAADAPLALIIDDLHWADPSTIELLAYLARREDLNGLLFLLAYRPTEMSLTGHPFVSIRQELVRRRLCRELRVSLLTEGDVRAYLDREFPRNTFPPEFAESLHARTEGSPFFLVELIQDLREQEGFVQTESVWRLERSPQELDALYPSSIQGMIERKIAQLPDDSRRLLVAAAVQGTEIESFVVARAALLDLATAEVRLRDLDQIHAFVRRVESSDASDSVPSETYAFVHVLYQDALYRSLTPTLRAALSRGVAEALLERNREAPEPFAAQLALLYETARDFRNAADWFLVAARNAARLYANQEAVELSRRAMVDADRLPDRERLPRTVQAALQAAELHLTLSNFEDAVADFGRAERAAEEADLIDPRIDAICGAALALLNLKRTDETRTLGERALRLANEVGSLEQVAASEAVLAVERMTAGDLDAAEALVDRASPVIRTQSRTRTPLHVIESIGYEAALHGWRLEYDQAFPPCQWALERARESGVVFHIACLLFIRGLGYANLGRLTEALADLHEATRLSEINQERYWLPRLPNTLAWLHAEMFDFDEAFALNRKGILLAQQSGFPEGEANSRINLARDHLILGEPDNALEQLQRAETLLQADPWFRWVYSARLQAEFARYWLIKGDLKRASAFARVCLDQSTATRRRKYVAWSRKLLGDIAAREERREDAKLEYEKGLAILRSNPCPTISWRILRAAGDLAHRTGRQAEGLRYRSRSESEIKQLADSIPQTRLRRSFLKEVRMGT